MEREGRTESQYDAVGAWEGIRFTPRFLDDFDGGGDEDERNG